MAKLIALIVFILMLIAGIVLVALGVGVGLLLLVVGMLGTVMMGLIVAFSRGSYSDFLSPRGFFDAAPKTKVEKQNNTNIWDEMTQKRDEK